MRTGLLALLLILLGYGQGHFTPAPKAELTQITLDTTPLSETPLSTTHAPQILQGDTLTEKVIAELDEQEATQKEPAVQDSLDTLFQAPSLSLAERLAAIEAQKSEEDTTTEDVTDSTAQAPNEELYAEEQDPTTLVDTSMLKEDSTLVDLTHIKYNAPPPPEPEEDSLSWEWEEE